jgi:hypothetical protein
MFSVSSLSLVGKITVKDVIPDAISGHKYQKRMKTSLYLDIYYDMF